MAVKGLEKLKSFSSASRREKRFTQAHFEDIAKKIYERNLKKSVRTDFLRDLVAFYKLSEFAEFSWGKDSFGQYFLIDTKIFRETGLVAAAIKTKDGQLVRARYFKKPAGIESFPTGFSFYFRKESKNGKKAYFAKKTGASKAESISIMKDYGLASESFGSVFGAIFGRSFSGKVIIAPEIVSGSVRSLKFYFCLMSLGEKALSRRLASVRRLKLLPAGYFRERLRLRQALGCSIKTEYLALKVLKSGLISAEAYEIISLIPGQNYDL